MHGKAGAHVHVHQQQHQHGWSSRGSSKPEKNHRQWHQLRLTCAQQLRFMLPICHVQRFHSRPAGTCWSAGICCCKDAQFHLLTGWTAWGVANHGWILLLSVWHIVHAQQVALLSALPGWGSCARQSAWHAGVTAALCACTHATAQPCRLTSCPVNSFQVTHPVPVPPCISCYSFLRLPATTIPPSLQPDRQEECSPV